MSRPIPHRPHHRQTVLGAAALVVALLASACSSTGSSGGDGDATTDPCDPIGVLEPREYNDLCVPPTTAPAPGTGSSSTPSTSDDDGIDWPMVLAAAPFNLWVWPPSDGQTQLVSCPNPTVAILDELLIGVDQGTDAATAIGAVRAILKTNGIDSDELPPLGIDPQYLYGLKLNGSVTKEYITEILPQLQGVGWSTGFNYVEFAQPNYGLRPYDEPEKATELPPPALGGGQGRVLVVDSPVDKDFPNDQQKSGAIGAGLLDESNGHGEFIQSLIKAQAPDATVDLAGIIPDSRLKLPSGRWAPMMFSDADVQLAFQTAVNNASPYDIVNLSLGGAGCPDRDLDERMALARAMKATAATSPGLTFVAAAGNAGNPGLHYPAAWRSPSAFVTMSTAVAKSGNPDANQISLELTDLRDYFDQNMKAVGSEENGARSVFSNCGDWINAVANGWKQVADYPTPGGPLTVQWSGTSFAAANVSAALAAGGPVSSPTRGAFDVSNNTCQ